MTTLEISDATEYRYVRFFGGDNSNGNVAEIELFGRHNFDYDDRTLPYLIAKTGILVESDWSADSWMYLTDVLATAQGMIQEGGSEALYALATDMLDDALNTLVPAPSYVEFMAAGAQANEADGSVTLLVSRAGGSIGPVSADFVTVEGSASAGEDFVDVGGALTWADGDMNPKAIIVELIDDDFLEDGEHFSVRLHSSESELIGDADETVVMITDDDVDALPGVSVSDASVTEGTGSLRAANKMQFKVSLSAVAPHPVLVVLRTEAGTAKTGRDFIPRGQVVRFDIGEKSRVVDVKVRPDSKVEDDEQFYLKVIRVKGAQTQDGEGVGTIEDDD